MTRYLKPLAVLLICVPMGSLAMVCAEEGSGGGTTLKGEYTFGGRRGPFVANMKASGADAYEVVYNVTFNGRAQVWKGTIKSDLKGEISGAGSLNGRTFEFSGAFVEGVAKCQYKETGGRGRSGSLTITK